MDNPAKILPMKKITKLNKEIEDEENKEIKYYDEILNNVESVFISEYYNTIFLYNGNEEIIEIGKMKIKIFL